MTFDVIPAIDLRGGRVVRLRQGDYAQETVFGDDPVELARGYGSAGAAWLHVVDLDGARTGRFDNLRTLTAIAGLPGLRIQAGGGVRSATDVQRLLDAGASRVVVGSHAVLEPAATAAWIGRFGAARIVPALDAREEDGTWRLPVHGWTNDVDRKLDELAGFYAQAGAQHLLCTDIARDGTLGGFNLRLYADLRDWAPRVQIIASGGARTLDDIRAARTAGAGAVLLGRALLEGAFTLQDALQC